MKILLLSARHLEEAQTPAWPWDPSMAMISHGTKNTFQAGIQRVLGTTRGGLIHIMSVLKCDIYRNAQVWYEIFRHIGHNHLEETLLGQGWMSSPL